jgi:MinD-like ATPase involved in chromosome partitioning or flagellar assembly
MLLVSATELAPELKLSLSELNTRGVSFVTETDFSRVLSVIKMTGIDTVIINSHAKKLESYELAREIRHYFKSLIKVFVYLLDSNPNEGSRFGLVNAEVEDAKTVMSLVDKVFIANSENNQLNENITVLYSLHGGAGASSISIALAEYLTNSQQKTLIAENSNNSSIKKLLRINPAHSFFSEENFRVLNQNKDLDWFKAFLNESSVFAGLFYLELFKNIFEAEAYKESMRKKFLDLGEELQALNPKTTKLYTENDCSNKLTYMSNLIKLYYNEITGQHITSFYEIIQLGSQIFDNFIFDIGSDISSALNRQILKAAKTLVIVFRDKPSIKEEYSNHKNFLEQEFNLKIIPVLSCDSNNNLVNYKKLSDDDWLNLLGDVPVIYPFVPEALASFVFDDTSLMLNKKIYDFARELSERINPNTISTSKLLKLVHKKSLINWG